MNKLKKAENMLLENGSITIRDIQNAPIYSNGANKIMQILKSKYQVKEDWIKTKGYTPYKRFTLIQESNIVNGQLFDKKSLGVAG